ncbi:hypothetical protein C8J57DRAFT_1368652 [Mycena rebaudengoi]|nr:hypothetical protein C8J57DRAFT_1368652 [Mycena rebaudengoi]
MEKELLDPTGVTEFLVLDLMAAHRTETNAAQCIARCARELVLNMRTPVICGLVRDSGLHADFGRAEVPLAFDAEEKCLAWCQRQRHWSMSLDSKLPDMDHQAMGGAFRTFCRLVDFDVSLPRTALDRFLQNGGHIAIYLPGWVIDPVLFCAFNSSLQIWTQYLYWTGGYVWPIPWLTAKLPHRAFRFGISCGIYLRRQCASCMRG